MYRTAVLWGLLLGGWVSIVYLPGLLTARAGEGDAPPPLYVQRGTIWSRSAGATIATRRRS